MVCHPKATALGLVVVLVQVMEGLVVQALVDLDIQQQDGAQLLQLQDTL